MESSSSPGLFRITATPKTPTNNNGSNSANSSNAMNRTPPTVPRRPLSIGLNTNASNNNNNLISSNNNAGNNNNTPTSHYGGAASPAGSVVGLNSYNNTPLPTPSSSSHHQQQQQQLHTPTSQQGLFTPSSQHSQTMISPTSDLRTEFWKSRPTVSIVTGPLFVSTSAQHASAGVGIILVDGLVGNRIGVLTVVADSPAERCGQICAGDRIHSINGRNVQEWTLEKVKEAVLGPAGTSVTFVLERGDNERFAVTLTRQSQVALEQRTKALEERIQRMARELHAAHRLREEATLRRLESVIGVWRNRSTASAFMCWKSGTERWSRNRTIVTRVLHRMQNLLKARMFQVLADNATNARRVRVVERALGRWRMGAATRAFAAWHKKAAHAERRRNIVRRVALRLQRLGLARAFDAMHRVPSLLARCGASARP